MSTLAATSSGAPRADIHADRILILDFGAQYTQLIARRVRESGVYCEIHPWDVTDADVRAFKPRGVVLSGGPESVTDKVPPRAPDAVFSLGVPVLGICYGMQTMAQQLGGRVVNSDHREFGYAEVAASACRLFDGLYDRRDAAGRAVFDVWMSRQVSRRSARAWAHRSPPWLMSLASSTLCSFIPRSRTRSRAHACSSALCAKFAAARRSGRSATSSRMPSSACAPRWAKVVCC
jgi:GMP synthase (glutamine-hydrolysing) A subunit